MAIDYVIAALNGEVDTKYDYIHIVPVAITYLHREMLRSDVSVRINVPIKIDRALLEEHGLNITHKTNQDKRYEMAKAVTSKLFQSISDSTISSPEWHSLCLSHLARQVAFPESSSPRLGSFLAQYVDLTRKFNEVVVRNKENENVRQCVAALDSYWKLLYRHGLKDNRVLEMQRKTSRVSIVLRLIYRSVAALWLWGIATPGFVMALPLVAAFRYIRHRKIKRGIARNYDEVAQTKVSVH